MPNRIALSILALALFACGENNQSVIITQPPPLPLPVATAPPSPTGQPGAGCIAPAVRVGPFGFQCDASVPTPSNNSGLLPRGCTAVLTATPKYPDGTDVPAAIHGVNVAWAITAGQNVVTMSDFGGEPFNRLIRPLSDTTPDPADRSSGTFTVTATVCGTVGSYTATVP
jgi:hypothetical protein